MGKDSQGQNITKDDADKLYALFRKGPHKGGLNYNDTHAKYIRKEVFEKHFPTKKLNNFRTWYRRKARAYGLNLELEGAREKKKKAKGKWLLVVLLSAVFVVLSSCFGLLSEAADEEESSEGSEFSDNKEEH